MTFDTLLLSADGPVSTITINRPPMNLMTPHAMDELLRALDALEADRSVRAIVLTGAGERAFCAGADIGEEELFDAHEARAFREAGREFVRKVEGLPKPVIAAIDGYCMGGGTGLAWPCDIRIATERARFGARDPYLGIVPTWSVGMVRLARYIGKCRAMDVLLLGEFMPAAELKAAGLISKVVPNDALMAEAMKVAHTLASAAPIALARIKRAVVRSTYGTMEEAAEFEERACMEVFATEDAREGLRAFREKRKAVFKGR
jgi:enoyl-CoA hydratase/carnithine racemase